MEPLILGLPKSRTVSVESFLNVKLYIYKKKIYIYIYMHIINKPIHAWGWNILYFGLPVSIATPIYFIKYCNNPYYTITLCFNCNALILLSLRKKNRVWGITPIFELITFWSIIKLGAYWEWKERQFLTRCKFRVVAQYGEGALTICPPSFQPLMTTTQTLRPQNLITQKRSDQVI